MQSFINAQLSDPISAFGGIVACNFKLNKKIALEINKTFFSNTSERFDKRAQILKRKKNIRIMTFQKLFTRQIRILNF